MPLVLLFIFFLIYILNYYKKKNPLTIDVTWPDTTIPVNDKLDTTAIIILFIEQMPTQDHITHLILGKIKIKITTLIFTGVQL